jgi:hypothetical protein
MIEMAMLIALGFLAASILAVLFAGPFWRRAVRLTKKRLEATMPMTIADIEADKDRLRAEYAVRLRRLEMAHDREKENAARFLVERNKHRVEINELKEQVRTLTNALAERDNESTVLEQTVRKRIPELEAQLERARQIIAARDRDLARMTTAYENQTEALGIAKKAAQRYSEEIERLREALEGGGAGTSRRGRGESEDALTEENQRLQAEISRLRQEVAKFKEVEAAENAALRAELQTIADQIMHGTRPAAPAKKRDKAKAKEDEPAEAAATDDSKPEGRKKPARRRAPKSRARKKSAPSLGDRLKKLTAKEEA